MKNKIQKIVLAIVAAVSFSSCGDYLSSGTLISDAEEDLPAMLVPAPGYHYCKAVVGYKDTASVFVEDKVYKDLKFPQRVKIRQPQFSRFALVKSADQE